MIYDLVKLVLKFYVGYVQVDLTWKIFEVIYDFIYG